MAYNKQPTADDSTEHQRQPTLPWRWYRDIWQPAPIASLRPRKRRTLAAVDGGRVLDVGCVGSAPDGDPGCWLHGHLETVADELVGVDVEKPAVERFQSGGWDVRADDAQTLNTVHEPVDVVVAGEVIEHLANPGQFLQAARAVLAPGGKVVLTTPNPWAVCYLRRAIRGDPVGNEEHTCWLDETTLRELAGRAGFEATVEYIEPSAGGLAAAVWPFHRRFGGTRLFAELRPDGGETDG